MSGLWVAVGYGYNMTSSSNGNDWNSVLYKGNLGNSGLCVAYGKDGNDAGLWVAGGAGDLIIKSSYGNDLWSSAATVAGVSGKGGLTNFVLGVAYGKDGNGAGLWVAVGEGGVIAKSSNGNNWSAAASIGGLTKGRGVAYGKDGNGTGLWVAVGDSGIIAKSSNGNDWNPVESISGITDAAYGVAYGKDNNGTGLWVAVGYTGSIVTSSNGNNWSAATYTGGLTISGWGVAFKEELFKP